MRSKLLKLRPWIIGLFFVWLIAVFVADTLHISIPPTGRFFTVTTEELLEVSQDEFEIQFEAINSGKPQRPFKYSPDGEHWFEHSKQVVLFESKLTEAIKNQLMSPVSISLDNYVRNDTWFEPRLSLRVDVFSKCLSEDLNAYSNELQLLCHEDRNTDLKEAHQIFYSYYEVSFHKVDDAWQVRAVWSPEKYFEIGDNRNSFFNRYCMKAFAPTSEQCASDQKPWFVP